MAAKKIVTFGELFDAIEKNGLEQSFGTWFATDNLTVSNDDTWLPPKNEIMAGCAIGQAAINLGVKLHSLRYPTEQHLTEYGIIGTIESWNDDERLTLEQIAVRGREIYADHLNDTLGSFEVWE